MPKKSKITIIPVLGLIICLLLVHPAELRSSPENAPRGKAIFEAKCSACHTIGGRVRVGPDLKGITDQRSTAWLTNFISNPDKMIKSGDPVANSLLKKFNGLEMPNLGLSGEQVSDVLAYLQSTSTMAKAQAPPTKAQAPAPVAQAPAVTGQLPSVSAPGGPVGVVPAGSAEMGENLFRGLVAFQKGGPPCMSCHDFARIPFPGGGNLGPDLTGVFAKFGATSMNSVLATLPFPTMRPIFDQRPLRLQEQQDLEAFFEKAGVQSLISRSVQIGLSAVGGLIILIILAWIIWQNRLGNVRKALVRSVRSSE
jgi:mono/diheme cytochrome c family protein